MRQTKFEIILYANQGNKKVGECRFDVAKYLNDRLKTPKEYEVVLERCPDKNAKLAFKLSAKIEEEISPDTISHSSNHTVNVETLVNGQVSDITKSSIQTPNQKPPRKDDNVPTKDTSARPPHPPPSQSQQSRGQQQQAP